MTGSPSDSRQEERRREKKRVRVGMKQERSCESHFEPFTVFFNYLEDHSDSSTKDRFFEKA